MPKLFFYCVYFAFAISATNAQQKVIHLYNDNAPGSETWTWQEQENTKNPFNARVIYNVTQPTLTAYLPPAAMANGTAVIVAPGGGWHTLSIEPEGIDVAKWLNTKGVAAFVLKYRLVHMDTDDPIGTVMEKMKDRKKFDESKDSMVKMSIADGLKAIEYVRTHAAEYNINPKRVGIMGFSAGGTLTIGTVFTATVAATRPDFAAPIYPNMSYLKNHTIPTDAPPLFICAASDDQVGLASHSSNLYNEWISANKVAELHMYEKGGHGFGIRKLDIPTDTWIERFGDWLDLHGWLWPENPTGFMAQLSQKQVKQMRKDEEERLRTDWAYLKRYEEENKMLSPSKPGENRVVFIGSSRVENWRKYDSAFFIANHYINRGVSGQTSSQMLLRFRQDVIDLKPSAVVFLGGSNDIAQNTGPTTLDKIAGNIASMAELAKANGIKVVLCSELPVYDYPWRPGLEPAEKIIALNKLIKAYAVKDNITYIDLYSLLVDKRKGMKKELTTDGVHPNLAGYKIMEPFVQKAIEKAIHQNFNKIIF
ncbi:GDSL-type esterase/lipase family protein [Chitinophagaceae bacterium LB-8]|uniref:GDSL-type esterase/lipase family protein n=1 Tax=Paraflavisolibacter caeni TaxID=2982496 RepID=A0A9X3BFW3_9BACT|nr:GDSL-type esterase/lipase family protein [Paraflavisolibacter caeni]MCU7549774.1 GDSL-type esterase/lipase family protein [Paraflavisolibacter caeni]